MRPPPFSGLACAPLPRPARRLTAIRGPAPGTGSGRLRGRPRRRVWRLQGGLQAGEGGRQRVSRAGACGSRGGCILLVRSRARRRGVQAKKGRQACSAGRQQAWGGAASRQPCSVPILRNVFRKPALKLTSQAVVGEVQDCKAGEGGGAPAGRQRAAPGGGEGRGRAGVGCRQDGEGRGVGHTRLRFWLARRTHGPPDAPVSAARVPPGELPATLNIHPLLLTPSARCHRQGISHPRSTPPPTSLLTPSPTSGELLVPRPPSLLAPSPTPSAHPLKLFWFRYRYLRRGMLSTPQRGSGPSNTLAERYLQGGCVGG